ncbi:class A beta-lactamase-related serine hydrolase [Allokutzneria sp. A3M-2-11 16]|uniref:serine hydrolase n=1 Tax=Allokutzneria sp. A3M-2-11 16 TaxID=2962043 RepID=UPI0020B7E890|nr:serine hydrolase [Allokutzneria sp. A3M-2-11 16]MCP3801822.1 class A beta-lactamase-related serine hydrolase [Allokutzneria sp. A3M-2-11 16]
MLSRRHLLGAAALAVPATLVLPGIAQAEPPKTPDAWVEWLRGNKDKVGVHLDNGKGGVVAHRQGVAQPLASAMKIVHLAAYATAVAEKRLDSQRRVRIADWESYYLPNMDGGAHPAALKRLNIPLDPSGLYAADPRREVALDDLALAMITFSDNAATDYLAVLLGEPELRRAAAVVGWAHADIRMITGEMLIALHGEDPKPVEVRKATGIKYAKRYASDPKYREWVIATLYPKLPGYEGMAPWANATWAASAHDLAKLHRALATGNYRPTAAAPIARTHLERSFGPNPRPGFESFGFKGGSLSGGILTLAFGARRTDGTVSSGAMLFRGLSLAEFTEQRSLVDLVINAAVDPAWQRRVADALGTRPGMLGG